MKAIFTKNGQLQIVAETDAEIYALQQWINENVKQIGQESEKDFIIKENKIWFNSELLDNKKSPLGLKPKWLHDDLRRIEVQQAIERYNIAGMVIPEEWKEELKNLTIK